MRSPRREAKAKQRRRQIDAEYREKTNSQKRQYMSSDAGMKIAKAASAKYAAANMDKVRARKAVQTAVRNGTLQAAPDHNCQLCGKPARWYRHYKGYARVRWLDVIPICTGCAKRNKKAPAE
jgi:hypothetical protein